MGPQMGQDDRLLTQPSKYFSYRLSYLFTFTISDREEWRLRESLAYDICFEYTIGYKKRRVSKRDKLR